MTESNNAECQQVMWGWVVTMKPNHTHSPTTTSRHTSTPCSARDFQLNLTGAVTLQELQMKRLQLLEAYERQRLAVSAMIESISMFCWL